MDGIAPVNPASTICKFLIVVAITCGNIRRNALGFSTDDSLDLTPSYDFVILIEIFSMDFQSEKIFYSLLGNQSTPTSKLQIENDKPLLNYVLKF